MLFFAAFYVYLWQDVQPQVIYHGEGVALPNEDKVESPVGLQAGDYVQTFLKGSGNSAVGVPIYWRGEEFFRPFLNRPGGLLEYSAARLCQYYYYPLLGPLLLTAIALALFWLIAWTMRSLGVDNPGIVPYLGPLLLAIVYGQYTFELEQPLGLVAALAVASGYIALGQRIENRVARASIFLACAAVLYYLVGGLFFLFAATCSVFELLAKRRYLLGAIELVAAGLIPLAGVWLGHLSPAVAYWRLLGIYPWEGLLLSGMLVALGLLLPLTVAWSAMTSTERPSSRRWIGRLLRSQSMANRVGLWPVGGRRHLGRSFRGRPRDTHDPACQRDGAVRTLGRVS